MRLLLVLLILFPAIGAADDGQPVFAVGPNSSTSCGQFIAATNGHNLNTHTQVQRNGVKFVSENEVMLAYVYGILTGINTSRDAQHQIQNDNASIELWLRNWCNKNPTSSLFYAVSSFALETPGTPLK